MSMKYKECIFYEMVEIKQEMHQKYKLKCRIRYFGDYEGRISIPRLSRCSTRRVWGLRPCRIQQQTPAKG
jgi:hypothetical protein